MKSSRFSSNRIIGLIGLIIALFLAKGFLGILPVLFKFLIVAALIALVCLVVAVVYSGLHQDKEETQNSSSKNRGENPAMTPEQKKKLADARSLLVQTRMLGNRLKNADIREQNEKICIIAEKILAELKNDPKDIHGARRVMSYYLPSLNEILTKYQKLENSETDISDMTDKVKTHLEEIRSALQRQYDNLFENDKLDLTVEMKAMDIAFKRDGLVPEDFEASRDIGEVMTAVAQDMQ